ncbi:MAG: zinc-dependent alcohol dehydrogenase family protein [bacterium]
MRLFNPAPVESSPLQPVELPIPEPHDGELRVRVQTCGVCHTDIHEIEGDLKLPRLPLTLGHEIVGVVDKLGPGVDTPPPGTAVGIPWLASTCGRCRFCRKGQENLCENIQFTGFHTDGGYAEYTLVRAGYCYPLPENLNPVSAAPLLCAGVIGYRALRLALLVNNLTPPSLHNISVGLYGFGASAHIVLQIIKHWGCRAAVFTRSPIHQQHARQLGADWVGTAQEKPPFEIDAGVIFAPVGELVPLALTHLDRGGILVLAGIHMSKIPPLDYPIIYYERVLRSVANSTRQDVIELLRLAKEIPLRTTTTPFPLIKANEALLRVKQSLLPGAAVLTVENDLS